MEPAYDDPEQSWHVDPSGPLNGDVRVAGSKNAITKHMVAAMLGRSQSRIENSPSVRDVGMTAEILRSLGVGVEVSGDRDQIVTIDPTSTPSADVPLRYTGLNRIPILLLGPLLHLTGEAFVPLVGGDKIGARPVDFHVETLRKMGAEIEVGADGIRARTTGLKGTRIELPYPSVGATETALLSAVLAEGRTVIHNAATEPEIIEVALFLQRMGAHLELRPGRQFVIEGVPELKGATTTLEGDRLEAFSYLAAGLVSGGEVRVAGCGQARLVTAINTLHSMGATFDITDGFISARADGLKPAAVQTDTHPGFMTDWQPPLIVLFTQADGMSVLHETVFEDRLRYSGDVLKAMGGEIELFKTCLGGPACRFHDTSAVHSAVVRGVSKLRGSEVNIPDIRAGFSGVLAAAVAEGPSLLHGMHHLERGYNHPFETFSELGLELRRADG